jgi:hypothetical protein
MRWICNNDNSFLREVPEKVIWAVNRTIVTEEDSELICAAGHSPVYLDGWKEDFLDMPAKKVRCCVNRAPNFDHGIQMVLDACIKK